MLMLETEVRVQTPEQVRLEFSLAGIGSRAVAQLIDLIGLAILYVLVYGGLYLASWLNVFGTLTSYLVGVVVVLSFFIFWGYFIALEYFLGGRTLGKWIMRIRTVRQDGRPVTFFAAMVRNLVRIVDMLPTGYLVGVIVMMVDKWERRLGDLLAGTMVVLDRPLAGLADSLIDQTQGVRDDAENVLHRVELKGNPTLAVLLGSIPYDWEQTLKALPKRLKQTNGLTQEQLLQNLWSAITALPGVRIEVAGGSVASTDLWLSRKELKRLFVAVGKTLQREERRKHKGV